MDKAAIYSEAITWGVWGIVALCALAAVICVVLAAVEIVQERKIGKLQTEINATRKAMDEPPA